MKRQFRGEICVYCRQRPADSDDHIFSRQFFRIEHRGNLPKAPACERCNGQKAQLETYLTAVLPIGSRLPGGIDNNVQRRLANNLKLVRELANTSHSEGALFPDGLVGVRTAFQFRYHHLDEYLCFAATGLAWHHFETCLPDEYAVTCFDFDADQAAIADQMFDLNCAKRAEADLGEGTVLYRGVQALDDDKLSMWQFRLFGGLRLGYSGASALEASASDFVVLLGSRPFLEGIRAIQHQATTKDVG